MKEKYIEERFPRWMISGEYTNGNVNITDAYSTFDAEISGVGAENLLNIYERLYSAFVLVCQDYDKKHPEDFKNFWYGEL